MQQLFMQNQWLLLLAILWTLPWKGIALWRAARRKEKWWFIIFLLVNTLAVLEIFYILIFSKKRTENRS